MDLEQLEADIYDLFNTFILSNEERHTRVQTNLNFLKMCIYSHTYCVCKDTHNVCIYSVYMVHMKARGQHT